MRAADKKQSLPSTKMPKRWMNHFAEWKNLFNLQPVIGEVNRHRSNFSMAVSTVNPENSGVVMEIQDIELGLASEATLPGHTSTWTGHTQTRYHQ